MPLTPLCRDRGGIHPLIVRDIRGREGGGLGIAGISFYRQLSFLITNGFRL